MDPSGIGRVGQTADASRASPPLSRRRKPARAIYGRGSGWHCGPHGSTNWSLAYLRRHLVRLRNATIAHFPTNRIWGCRRLIAESSSK
jgi:hypothetical protein